MDVCGCVETIGQRINNPGNGNPGTEAWKQMGSNGAVFFLLLSPPQIISHRLFFCAKVKTKGKKGREKMENEDITSLVPTKYLVALEGHSFSAEVMPAYRPHAYTHSAK